MPAAFFPNSRVISQITALKTELALSVVKLFKGGFVPDVDTVVGDLDANECDYDDYAPETITAFNDIAKAIGGGFQITAPTVQFAIAAAQVVPNTVGGYWIELAGGAVVMIKQFDDPVNMAFPYDSIEVNPTIIVGNGIG